MEQTTINTEELFTSLDTTWYELFNLVDSVDEAIINTIPFKDSWTIAQVATHVKKSNNGIIQGLQMDGNTCNRNPEEGVTNLKKIFLDFSAKYNSPGFIVPDNKQYQKDAVTEQLKNSIEKLKQLRDNVNFVEMNNLPALGEITKIEMLHFVLYHTQRHIHQLKNILNVVNNN